jgi:hypothetical protein
MNATPIHYTPTQQRIMRLLADGLPHHGIKEIKPLLPDAEHAGPNAVNMAITRLRAKLNTMGQTIVCELVNRRICFRYVILVAATSSAPQ